MSFVRHGVPDILEHLNDILQNPCFFLTDLAAMAKLSHLWIALHQFLVIFMQLLRLLENTARGRNDPRQMHTRRVVTD